MKDLDELGVEQLRTYSLTIGMGFSTLYGAVQGSTMIMDEHLIQVLISLGVPYTKCGDSAGLTQTEFGHEEL